MSTNIGQMPARGGQLDRPVDQPRVPTDTLHFATDPTLRDLLHPDVVIRPGIEYLACALVNIPRAESEGFRTMSHQRSFMIRGIPCVVMTRGKPTPGGRDSSQLVLLKVDKACDPAPVRNERPFTDEELEAATSPEAKSKSK